MGRAPALRMILTVSAAVVALLSAFASPAGAMIRPVSADYLARTAQTIVLARATAVQSYRAADLAPVTALGGTIVTDVRLRVHKLLKGEAAARITLTIPGGRVGGLGLTNPDAPSFQRGGTYLVYLDGGGQIVAWRRGQPLVISGRVPDLGATLQQIERRIAKLTGRQATVYSLPAEQPASGRTAAPANGSTALGTPAFVVPPATGDGSGGRRLGAPVITGISPGSASAGTGSVVTVTGSGFGAAQGSGKVLFFYQADANGYVTPIEAPIASWTDTAIACVVPTAIIADYAASAGTGPVYVTLDGATFSNGYPFSVTFSYGGLQWPRDRCQFRINGSGHSDWEAAVRQAAATWTGAAAGGFAFSEGGPAPSGAVQSEQNGYNDIVWGPISDPNVIASAWTYDLGRSILETDIVFNTALLWGTSGGPGEMDVETIAVHELGHWLTLRDLYGPQDSWGPGDTAKIMFGFCDYGIVKRTPDAADAEGVQWVYSSARRDTRRPTSTVAKPAKVRRSRVVNLTLLVRDPEYSCGAADLRILISDSSGRTVVRLLGWATTTNEWGYVPYRCKLPRGVYRWRVQATDLTGHRQIKVGSAKLVVR